MEEQSELAGKYMEELVLTEEEMQLVLKYLIGEAGEEVVAKLPVQDLLKSSIQWGDTEIFQILPLETAEKVFQVLMEEQSELMKKYIEECVLTKEEMQIVVKCLFGDAEEEFVELPVQDLSKSLIQWSGAEICRSLPLETAEKVFQILMEEQSKLVRKYMGELVLTEEEMKLALKYLIGEAGEEVIAKLPVRDLSKSSIQGSGTEIFRILPLEIAGKVFQVLYAVGGSSCSGMFSLQELMQLKKEKRVWIEANQIATFAADYVVRNCPYHIDIFRMGSVLESVIQVIELIEFMLQVVESSMVLKALGEYRGEVGGRIFLWTIYFLIEYPEAELGKETVILKRDQEYLTWYENCVFAYLKEVLEQKRKSMIEEKEWDRIEMEFRSFNLSKEFIKSLGEWKTDDFFAWNSTLIFVNSALSDCFRNIVGFWFEKGRRCNKYWDYDWKLLEMLDFRRDLELRGGFFVQWFGVDPKQYIVLAAELLRDSLTEELLISGKRRNYVVKKKDSMVKGWRNTLSVLFQQYPEVFSQYCEEFFTQKSGKIGWEERTIWDKVLLLYEVMEEQDLKFFREYLQRIQPVQKEQMIAWITEGQKDEEAKKGIRKYLEEEAGVEAVFFIRDRLESSSMSFVIADMLEIYHRCYKDLIFCYRCLICSVLCEEESPIWVILGERITQIFQMLDLEGIDLEFQIKMMMRWKEKKDKEKGQAFESEVKPVFLEYLKTRRKIITDSWKMYIYGKYFSLLNQEMIFLENENIQMEYIRFARDMAEELTDRSVPNFGFQLDGKRIFDYGERKFTVFLLNGFELEVTEESGKKLKSLPAPGKRDDPEKATAAYKEWKQVKKQIKTVVDNQKLRLEQVFLLKRKWKIAAWRELFLENPLMVPFAVELIWGVYQEGRLLQSFRYMGEGIFVTGEKEVFVLPETGKIGLVHPIELSKEEKVVWRKQIEDSKIVQPIEQLNRVIFELSEKEKQLNSLEWFRGFCMGDMQLERKILSLGWEYGTYGMRWNDSTMFYYNRTDWEVGWEVNLYFSKECISWDSKEKVEVTLHDVRFYRIGEHKENECYEYGRKGVFLMEVPRQYFSEIIREISLVTASCGEREGRKLEREAEGSLGKRIE